MIGGWDQRTSEQKVSDATYADAEKATTNCQFHLAVAFIDDLRKIFGPSDNLTRVAGKYLKRIRVA